MTEKEFEDAQLEHDRQNYEAARYDDALAEMRAHAEQLAAQLAECAGYIASVRTARQITWHEELYALQTVEWAEGAVEIAEKANAVLDAHDAFLANIAMSRRDIGPSPTSGFPTEKGA